MARALGMTGRTAERYADPPNRPQLGPGESRELRQPTCIRKRADASQASLGGLRRSFASRQHCHAPIPPSEAPPFVPFVEFVASPSPLLRALRAFVVNPPSTGSGPSAPPVDAPPFPQPRGPRMDTRFRHVRKRDRSPRRPDEDHAMGGSGEADLVPRQLDGKGVDDVGLLGD